VCACVLWALKRVCVCVCVCVCVTAGCHRLSATTTDPCSPAPGHTDQGNPGSVFDLSDNEKLKEGRPLYWDCGLREDAIKINLCNFRGNFLRL